MPTVGESNKPVAASAPTTTAKPGKVSHPFKEGEPKPLRNKEQDPTLEEDSGDAWECKGPVPPGQEMVRCRNEECGNPAVRIWVGTITKSEWPMCLSCEKKDFGDNVEEEPTADKSSEVDTSSNDTIEKDVAVVNVELGDAAPTTTKPGSSEAMILTTPSHKGQDKVPFLTPQPGVQVNDQQDGDDQEEVDDAFELIDFVPFDKLKTTPPICSICTEAAQEEGASSNDLLFACTIWQGSDPKSKKWYYCIDCQESDFEGFPTKEDLIRNNALKNLDPATIQDHIKFMKQKCSQMRHPVVPDLGSYLPSTVSGKGAASSFSPNNNNKTNFVTPPPKSLPSAKSLTNSSQVEGSANGSKAGPKVTAKIVAMQRQWQQQAEELGGKGAKIIVDQKEAKKKIYHMMYDAFAPMNITDIFKALKATVPRPVLGIALKDMADKNSGDPFADNSDDEEEEIGKKRKIKEAKSSDEDDSYGPGSLCFKAGRNDNTNLYYVNYAKAKEMNHDERQELFAALAKVNAEKEELERLIKSNQAMTTQLLSEPTNDELIGLLKEGEETVASLRGMVEESRELRVNESTRIGLKKKIQKMTAHWSKRKRMCLTFLANLEEQSEGILSMRKALSGDGPLALDSDEAVVKAELQLASLKSQKRRKMGHNPRGIPAPKIKTDHSVDPSAPTLVAVRLEKGGKVERVYYDPEKNDGCATVN